MKCVKQNETFIFIRNISKRIYLYTRHLSELGKSYLTIQFHLCSWHISVREFNTY